MKCINCNSEHIQKDGNHNGMQRYKCMDCKKRFDFGKYQGNNNYIIHFNTKIKETKYNKLTRENYCDPTNKLDYRTKKLIRMAITSYKKNGKKPILIPECYYNIPNDIFSDTEHYTDEYVKLHYKDCMDNFDLNIEYFSKLNHEDFDKYLKSFVKKNRFNELKNLEEVKCIEGIYILVLDEYSQVYIGISNNIKRRILRHWSYKKEFSGLLDGSVNKSIISIDSFGALDTTRIFYKPIKEFQNRDEIENKYVYEFKNMYILNRVAGGINAENNTFFRNMKLLLNKNDRKLK